MPRSLAQVEQIPLTVVHEAQQITVAQIERHGGFSLLSGDGLLVGRIAQERARHAPAPTATPAEFTGVDGDNFDSSFA